MSATLAEIFPISATDPSKAASSTAPISLFSQDERDAIKELFFSRECQDQTFPPTCKANLFFGFFFDGTNNNLKRDRDLHSHSNVARLYSAYPGAKDKHGSEPWPEVKTKYHSSFFRTYVPGVGTTFEEVNDSGEGFTLSKDRPRGLGFCYKGENRIIWALVEAINNVYKYYTNIPLISEDEFKAKFNKLTLPGFGKTSRPRADDNRDFHRKTDMEKLESAFSDALRTLHSA